jgi:hypothetical protein
MLFANTYSAMQVVYPDPEIIVPNLRAFRAQVGLALAAADSVIVDLRATKRVDSWGLLEILDLAGTFAPRLAFATPDYLREILLRIDPEVRPNLRGLLPAD